MSEKVRTIDDCAEVMFSTGVLQEDPASSIARIAALIAVDRGDPEALDSATANYKVLVGGASEYRRLTANTLARFTLSSAYGEYADVFDDLTGLRRFHEYERWVESHFGFNTDPNRRRTRAETVAIYEGDLSNFKRVNDYLGHNVGNRVLEAAASEMQSTLRASDNAIIVRKHTKGDEFRIGIANINAEASHGLWERLMLPQLERAARQTGIWARIEEEKKVCPNPDAWLQYVEVRTVNVTVRVRNLSMKSPSLYINGKRICSVQDLAVVDWGHAHGSPGSMDELRALETDAMLSSKQVKAETHIDVGGAYRSTGQ